MTVYYVDDGGSNTSPFDTWAKAAPTLAALQASIAGSTGTGGNVIYIGADSVSSSDGAAVTFTGPTTGGPCYIISATVGTTTYAKSSSNQIITTGTLTWNGNFAVFGVRAKAGDTATLTLPTSASGANASIRTEDHTVLLASNRSVVLTGFGSTTYGLHQHRNLTIDASSDSGVQSSTFLSSSYGPIYINGLTLVDSSSHRTGPVIALASNNTGVTRITGADFSAATGLSAIVNRASGVGSVELHNCKTAASPTWITGTANSPNSVKVTNSGSADAPEYLYYSDYFGTVSSDTTIYMNSVASTESVPVAWKMVSSANANVAAPLLTPWVYGVVSATGSKTFDVYVTQDGGAGDLTDAEVWLELEYLGTSNVAMSTFATDRVGPSGAFSGAAAQTDDVTSTWAGTITETYMQKLSVTATVNEDGLYRARVALGKASTTLYVDPLVTVS